MIDERGAVRQKMSEKERQMKKERWGKIDR